MRTSITGDKLCIQRDWSGAHPSLSKVAVEAKEKGAFGLPSISVGLLSLYSIAPFTVSFSHLHYNII